MRCSTSSGRGPDVLTKSILPTLAASRNSFRSAPDPPPQRLIGEIHALSRHERRRQPQTLHILTAAGEQGAKLSRREPKQLFPVRDKGTIRETKGHFLRARLSPDQSTWDREQATAQSADP